MIDFSKVPRFNFAKVGGGQLPTQPELMGLISRFSTLENPEDFIAKHSAVMKFMFDGWRLPNQKQYYELIEELCNRTGHHFLMVLVEFMRMAYYRHLFGRTIVNLRTASNLVSKSQLSSGVNALDNRLEADTVWLSEEFPEFKKAFLLTESFKLSASVLAKNGDLIARSLLNELNTLGEKIIQEDALTMRNANIEGDLYETSVCQYCGTFFQVKRSKGVSIMPSHCGGNECTKAAQRLKPSKIRRAVAGWVSTGIKQRCISCTTVRFVNAERTCKKCFSKTFE